MNALKGTGPIRMLIKTEEKCENVKKNLLPMLTAYGYLTGDSTHAQQLVLCVCVQAVRTLHHYNITSVQGGDDNYCR